MFRRWGPNKSENKDCSRYGPQKSQKKTNVQDMGLTQVKKAMFRIWAAKKSNKNNVQDMSPNKSQEKQCSGCESKQIEKQCLEYGPQKTTKAMFKIWA